MSNEDKIVQLLTDIKSTMLFNISDYANTDEACKMLGITNYRFLGQLHNRDLLPRYKRAEGYVYKKSDLNKIREALDKGTTVLYPLNKKKD